MKRTDLKQDIKDLKNKFDEIYRSFNLEEKKKEIARLQAQSSDSTLWDDPDHAKDVMQTLSDIRNEVETLETIKKDIETLIGLSGDLGLEGNLRDEYKKLNLTLKELTVKAYLSGKYDSKNAMLSIHAGQGGVEAMDWVSMLHRMYVRFAEKKNWKVETLELSQGEEAGIKSIVLRVEGRFAYGYLKGEAGTHRLVRQSPFNADNLRQTSFALVGVLPELEELDYPDIKIKDEDLEWQFFRSSTQGGQNVQKVSTAVRVKHIPTGIVVSAQTERFQEQNRKIALNLLRGKLWLLEQERQKNEVRQIQGDYKPASWGHQIRNYVLHPYKMVKDLRTQVESSDPDSVLGGELEPFIEAELVEKVAN